MKTKIAFILCLTLLLFLSGCSYYDSIMAKFNKAANEFQPVPSFAPDENFLYDDKHLSEELAVYELVNQHREAIRFTQLRWDSNVSALARKHSQDMAMGIKPFGHNESILRADLMRNYFSKQIWKMTFAESVGRTVNVSNPAVVCANDWLSNQGHLNNIEGNYIYTGVGVANNSKGEYYFTQIFIG